MDQSKLKHKNAEINKTIVYFEPQNARLSVLPTTDAIITTQNKEFKPNVLAITAGSEVTFPNTDRILHNVFSVSPESEFDLGLYAAGTSKSVTFEESGVIYVHCNVHHSMQADILVLETPYFTQVDATGKFELSGLPELAGTLKIWHPRGSIKGLQLTGDMNNRNINQTVVITRPKVPKHRNKFGNTYRRKRY
ncbi:plastocyanin/azurin family copper-binding protein [Marinicella sp. W31]|uniref:cupredoxin domain-containing protein n=1 Tax=Marinicella sp. W31 TaxID=3023713 RepID=UPI003757D799